MFNVLLERLQQKHRTTAYPDEPAPARPARFRGLPLLDSSRCPPDCSECVGACPTDALRQEGAQLKLDMGRCLFCTDCMQACPEGAVRFSSEELCFDEFFRRLLAAGFLAFVFGEELLAEPDAGGRGFDEFVFFDVFQRRFQEQLARRL